MVPFTPLQRFPEQGVAPIRALSSLTPRDADAVRATVRAVGCAYSVQEHDDYDGYLSLLLLPTDAAAPSFLISGRTGAVDLAELDGDDMAVMGTFASAGAAMLVLRLALTRPWRAASPPNPADAAARLREQHGHDAGLHAALRADADPDGRRWSSILRAIDSYDAGE